MHTWTFVRSDHAVGADRALEVAAICATLVDPRVTALKLESSQLARDSKVTIAYHLHEACSVAGEPHTTASVKSWLLEGETPDNPATFDRLAVRDADMAIQNAKALIAWMRTGQRHHLAVTDADQRTVYQLGAPLIQPAGLQRAETPSLAKAAALGRFGCGLIETTGTPSAPRFVLSLTSDTSTLVDADGVPVTYDASQLIMGEFQDEFPLHHPFIVAYRAVLCWLDLRQTVATETHALVVTPDLLQKRGQYDPSGKQVMMHPNATGREWDDARHFFF
jgi:hypothetical protein